ncbi:MAG: hypothetical protein Q3971_07515 [Moraxella sp.]|nr:hypothetical protein [Moraxella sp.]
MTLKKTLNPSAFGTRLPAQSHRTPNHQRLPVACYACPNQLNRMSFVSHHR